MSAFTKLQGFLQELESSKIQLNDKKITLIMQRQAKAAEIDEALLTGDGADIQAALDSIDGEMAAIEQRIKVIDDTLEGRRKSPNLAALATAAVAESREKISHLQLQWNEAAGKLADLDAQRLAMVGDLGEIDRQARSLTFRAMQAVDHLPSPKPAAPSLATSIIIRHDRRSGIIFPDHAVIEKTFKGAI